MSKAVQSSLVGKARSLMKRYDEEVLAMDGTDCHKVAHDLYKNLCYAFLS